MSTFENISLEWIKKRKSNRHYSYKFLEKPAIFKVFFEKSLINKKVLCLGCGDGSECELIRSKGARVVGIDNSKSLINYAKYEFSEVEFLVQDIQNLNLPENSFDEVFSSLTFHYLKDWETLFAKLFKILKPGGRIVFSIHHPIKWGGQKIRNSDFNEFLLGYKKSKNNSEYEIYGDYLNERKIDDILFGKLKVSYYHRSFSQMFTVISDAGFLIKKIIEPKPLEISKKIVPDFYEVYSKIPLFIIFELTKT